MDTSAEKYFSNSDMINVLQNRIFREKIILIFNFPDFEDTANDASVFKDVFLKIVAPIFIS